MKRPAASSITAASAAKASGGRGADKGGWRVQTYARGGDGKTHGQSYKMWVAPDGTRYRSRTQAVMAGFKDQGRVAAPTVADATSVTFSERHRGYKMTRR